MTSRLPRLIAPTAGVLLAIASALSVPAAAGPDECAAFTDSPGLLWGPTPLIDVNCHGSVGGNDSFDTYGSRVRDVGSLSVWPAADVAVTFCANGLSSQVSLTVYRGTPGLSLIWEGEIKTAFDQPCRSGVFSGPAGLDQIWIFDISGQGGYLLQADAT